MITYTLLFWHIEAFIQFDSYDSQALPQVLLYSLEYLQVRHFYQ